MKLFKCPMIFFADVKSTHRYFVLVCKNHPFVVVWYRKDRCSCKALNYGTCDFCNNMERIIKDKPIKICSKKIPKNFIKGTPSKKYLQDKIAPCKCSFNFEGNKVYCKM